MANELVLVSSRNDDHQDSKHDNHDPLGVELDAMATIGRTLDAIKDPTLRQRILNWANERWGDRSSVAPVADAPSGAVTAHLANDPALSLDSIGELFGDAPAEPRPGTAPEILVPVPAAKAPVESMLQSLAADFRRLADEWNGDPSTNQ
jgi:hypothetical protein